MNTEMDTRQCAESERLETLSFKWYVSKTFFPLWLKKKLKNRRQKDCKSHREWMTPRDQNLLNTAGKKAYKLTKIVTA